MNAKAGPVIFCRIQMKLPDASLAPQLSSLFRKIEKSLQAE